MLKILQLFALSVFLTLPLLAQNVRVSGIVKSNGGIPVPGATVRVVQPSTGKGWVSWTDEAGKFELPGLPAGKLRFEVQQLGFEQSDREVEIAADSKPIELTIRVGGLPQATAAVAHPAVATPSPAAPSPLSRPSATPGEPAGPGQRGPGQGGPGGQRPAFAGARPGQPRGPAGGPAGAQGGFQQVDPTQLQAALSQQDAAPQIDTGPLGEAASSDAFLMSGSVGRGTTAGQDFSNFGPPGLGMMFGGPEGMPGGSGPGGMEGGAGGSNPFGGAQGAAGGPGGPGGDRMAVFMGAGGGPGGGGPGGARGGGGGGGGGAAGGRGGAGGGRAGQGGQQRNNPRAANARQQGPQAMEGLWGLNRIMRMAANRTRFGFYERFGTSAWDARPYSLTAVDPPKLSRIRQRAGFNIGGPMVIPKIYNGKEKTFYFLNYDFSRGRNPIDTFATVPTAAERAGDFSARGVQLFAPVAGSNVRTSLGSVIPQALISPASAGLLRFIPLPNLPGTVQNFHLQAKVPNSSDRINLRILHTINQKLNMQVTYGMNSSRSESVQNFPLLQGRSSSLGQNASIGLTQTYTPRFIHDSRITWSRSASDSTNLYSGSEDIAGKLGITGISTDPVNYGVPQIGFTNYTGLSDPVPAFRRNQQFRITDNVTWVKQKHTFRAGIEFRRGQNNNHNDPTARGSFTFTGLQSSQLDAQGRPVQSTGLDFADFLMGFPYSTNVRFGNSSTYYRSYGLTAFVQEDWRIHPRFSVNVGLRYEFLPPATELYNHLANLDINGTFTAVALVTPGQPAPYSGNLPDSLIRADKNNLAPRIGIAWRPNFMKRNTVIRAGYSMFYNGSVYDRLISSMANQPPFSQSQLRYSTATQLLTLTNGFPAQPLGTVNNTIAIDPNYRVGYAQIWNFTFETPVMRNLILDLTYTGTKGTGLDLLRSPNRAIAGTDLVRRIPNAAAFTYDQSGAMSIYHAGQVRLQKRMARGFMVGGTYTFAKSLDNASSIGGGAQVMVQDDTNFAAERGRSSFDIRHQFRTNYNWELPFGERRKWMSSGKRAAIFGNWSINGSVTANSGSPYTARMLGTASNNSGSGNNFSERPDQIGNPSLPGDLRTPLNFFNVAAFALPPSGRFGNASRNTITGPGVFSMDGSIAKNIRLGKDRQRRLDLRWEFSNLLNHPNYTGLNTVINSINAGRVQGARAMRTIDFQARFNF